MKQDQKLVAQKDASEISNVVSMLRRKNIGKDINRVTVKDVYWMAGRSRVVSYAIFKMMGYETAKTKEPTAEQKKKIKDVAVRMGLGSYA